MSAESASGLPRPLPLPEFPWDTLNVYREKARSYSGGIVDLSVGTPVDPTPSCAIAALTVGADAPGYPTTVGTADLRLAIREFFARRRGVVGLKDNQVLPTIGSKEMVAWLGVFLGIGSSDTVLHPKMAYPTYDVGARLAGARPVAVGDDPDEWPKAKLVWINSPGNPHGHVLGVAQLRKIVAWARQNGAIVVSDECYSELPWEEPWVSEGVPSLLDPRVTDGDLSGLLVLYSLSKQSNLAGYRAAMAAGDSALIEAITQVRKHAGMMVPAPVQRAMCAVLTDDEHVQVQYERYLGRREKLLAAVTRWGLISDSQTQAGLYLWLRSPRGDSSLQLVAKLAEIGILVAPGDFYGAAGAGWVRMALTGTDAHIEAAVRRLSETNLQ